MHDMAEGPCRVARMERVGVALPLLRMLLQQLLAHPGTFCEASLAFCGLEDVNVSTDGADGEEDEYAVQAVVELTDLSLQK
eukprot:CAMPEP_0171254972 /NCGR_PEP_ID=MMETSP0790-20130122/52515_1 /TAXON_ID=2925 /ORGANISM="Alexandrium catenella, Strain OF101" /LENGTH=80 /DNA_ID=CAMNT_0011722887 /DNA_START=30 /DNA_END=272 /DNA_ORIENTATION=-